MAAIKLTLQNRVTTLTIISSLFFISAFTFIQLNNQVSNINRFNTYQANLSSNIVKNSLESIMKLVPTEGLPSNIRLAVKELVDSGVIKEAIIFDTERNIIAASDSRYVGDTVSYKELGKITELENISRGNKSLLPEINKLKHSLDIYMGLRANAEGPIIYILRLSFLLGNIKEALFEVYQPVIFATIMVIIANIIVGYVLSKKVIGPIKVLNEVTKIIAAGDLSARTHINTQDELQELGATFNCMTEELIKMKERAENANPLTKLPGNIVIHEEVEKRIQGNQKFVVIYCDLDNFKAFNDKYGIAKGDEAIKLTADIFKDSAKNKGNPDDFVGHEGGDDFILISTPGKAQGVADYITTEFDKCVRSLYSQEDLAQGYIIAHARDGAVKQFPIMTISLAGITNETRTIASYGEVTNIAAEVKKKAKAIDGSVFVMDKRTV